jgi:hypothetical protein
MKKKLSTFIAYVLIPIGPDQCAGAVPPSPAIVRRVIRTEGRDWKPAPGTTPGEAKRGLIRVLRPQTADFRRRLGRPALALFRPPA